MSLKENLELIRILQASQPCSINWLAGSTEWPCEKVSRQMWVLQVAGMAKDIGSNQYELTPKAAGIVEFFDQAARLDRTEEPLPMPIDTMTAVKLLIAEHLDKINAGLLKGNYVMTLVARHKTDEKAHLYVSEDKFSQIVRVLGVLECTGNEH